MSYEIIVILALLEWIALMWFIFSMFAKKRTIYTSSLSIGKLPMYYQANDNILKSNQESLDVFIKYIESRMRIVVDKQNSENYDDKWREIIKDIHEIYKERWWMKQLTEIHSHMSALRVKSKVQ